jgi:hypothetical protein
MKSNFLYSVGLLFVVALGGCASTSPTSSTSSPPAPATAIHEPMEDHLIVPGQRIGPIYLGMTRSQLLQELGVPKETHMSSKDSKQLTNYTYEVGLTVTVDDSGGTVCGLNTTSSAYMTKEGVGDGASDLEAKVKLGSPTTTKQGWDGYAGRTKLEYLGIGMSLIEERGTVSRIEIYSQ